MVANMMWTIICIYTLFVASKVVTALAILSSDDKGTVFQLGERTFFANTTVPILTSDVDLGSPDDHIPATSIRLSTEATVTERYLQSQMSFFASVDNVWNRRFMKAVVLSYEGTTKTRLDAQAQAFLISFEVTHLFLVGDIEPPSIEGVTVHSLQHAPPIGPYIISSSSTAIAFHSVYRLFKDELSAFLFGTVPHPDPAQGWLRTNFTLPSDHATAQYIPVPSRLTLLSPSKPLSGMRFALKDIYNAQGLPTGAGSLAYAALHPHAPSTAPSIERLISLGATLVGKTPTSQFAQGANPWEFEDLPYSWNPRGDGFFTAASSSSGSACAIAGYGWLDFTVGSDTRGSVRKPAALVGVYGIRPTVGSLSLEGVLPLSEEMDTAGFFARDPRVFYEVAKLWYADAPPVWKRVRKDFEFPRRIIYPTDHFPVKTPAAQALYEEFVGNLERYLGMTKVEQNMTETIVPYLPNGSFAEFQQLSNRLAEYRSWHDVGRPLEKAFKARFPDRKLKLDPVPERNYKRARRMTLPQFEEAVAYKRSFATSIGRHVFKADEKACSESLFMYDAGTGGVPSYRVEEFNYLEGATPFLLNAPVVSPLTGKLEEPRVADFLNFLASMADLPEVTLPIGQVPYYSHITREWDVIPVAVQLVARKGCDGVLLEVVKKLTEVGVLKGVKTGRVAF